MNLKVFALQKANNSSIRMGKTALVVSFIALTLPTIQAGLAKEIHWSDLNLTPQQETQMQDLESDWQKTHQAVNNQIEKDMTELKTLLPSGDTQRIRQLQTRISNNKMYLMNESMDTFLKKRDMLTPSQRAQLQKMIPCKSQN